MSEGSDFIDILKYGTCDSSTHNRCKKARSKNLHSCPMPRYRDESARHICHCCETCYVHCVEEARQANNDYMDSYKIKRRIEDWFERRKLR